MDRYTARIGDSVYYTKGKQENKTLPKECDSGDVRVILNRLAQYEDSGLEPLEIEKLKAKCEAAEEQVKKLTTALLNGVANNERNSRNDRDRYGRR